MEKICEELLLIGLSVLGTSEVAFEFKKTVVGKVVEVREEETDEEEGKAGVVSLIVRVLDETESVELLPVVVLIVDVVVVNNGGKVLVTVDSFSPASDAVVELEEAVVVVVGLTKASTFSSIQSRNLETSV